MVDLGVFVVGEVVLIPYKDAYIMAQVGEGEDLGVFNTLITSEHKIRNDSLLFRVQFGRQSPKRFGWKRIGVRPMLADSLERTQPYGFVEIGEGSCFVVEYGRDDRKVDCMDISELEPLATWSHEHIIERFAKRCN